MYLRPNAAIVQLGDNISAVRKVKAEAAAAITALQRVIADRSLQGDGFNALREKLESFDLRLLKGLHSLCGEQETRYRWHQNSISSRFWGCSEVNSYSIQAQMQSVNAQIQRVVDLATAEGWLNLATLGAWSYYSLRQTYRTLEEKLEQLYQCDWETGALYETNIAIVECLNEGIQYINSMYYDPNEYDLYVGDEAYDAYWYLQLEALLSPVEVYGQYRRYGCSQESPLNLIRSRYYGDHTAISRLRELVRSYPQYQDYSDLQIEDLMRKLNSEGCQYAAFANSIFEQYHGRELEFFNTFGFPMYRSDAWGDKLLNQEELLVDLYCATDNKYFIGPLSLTNPFEDPHVLQGSGVLNPVAAMRFEKYMADHGVDVEIRESLDCSVEKYQELADEGTVVLTAIIGATYFNSTTKRQMTLGFLEGHATVITGVEDGKFVVSSWGEEYLVSNISYNAALLQVVWP